MAITVVAITSIEKYLFAFSLSPSPRVLPTIAEPPAPSIKPREAIICTKGYIRLSAAKGVFPT